MPFERNNAPGAQTTAYTIWPYMVLIEGPVGKIGHLLLDLYDDRTIDRKLWTVDHPMRSRRTYAEHLMRSGHTSRRQGIGAKDSIVVRAVQARCGRLGLDCHVFAKPR